ncbi:hypothetical protein E1B28_000143 [Marasmius oreades]|uniref:Carbonic anhydrase n=1 Tax=Marasmius oreades TaxID=181124 RepID=A0A9P8AEA6_9AGAR|nr:uncharacterized protein E1B28_000143 [Marasmius oreades]KAG7098175.1 hypothetical protein E1B28_000143 [Marasmius oreades]
MSAEYVKNNEKYAKEQHKSPLPVTPTKKILILTCMDARIDVFSALGLEQGEAHIVRNGGGRVQDAIRSIVVSQRLLGTREVLIIHHTDCGFTKFTTDHLIDILGKEVDEAGRKELDKIGNFGEIRSEELEESVKEDVRLLKAHPLVLKDTKVSGWIFRVEDGKLVYNILQYIHIYNAIRMARFPVSSEMMVTEIR